MIASCRSRRSWCFAAALVVAAWSSETSAWEQDTECTTAGDEYTSDTFTFNISTNDFSGTGTAYTTIHQAGDLWDGAGSPVPGTSLEVAKGTDCTLEEGAWWDGLESVTAEDLTGIGIALTSPRCSGGVIVECDIAFMASATWHPDPPTYGETGLSRRVVMSHEVGHCLGFDHDDARPDTLMSVYPNAGNIGGRASIGESSRDGARDLYPDSSTGTDLGVSGLRMGDGTGETEWVPYWSTGGGTQEAQAAWPGNSIYRAYCIHNLGTTTETATVKLYLSTDDALIETTDTVLGSYSVSVTPNNDPYCPPRLVTIPSGTPAGTYWIGSIIDPSDTISESLEDNNRAKDAVSFTVY